MCLESQPGSRPHAWCQGYKGEGDKVSNPEGPMGCDETDKLNITVQYDHWATGARGSRLTSGEEGKRENFLRLVVPGLIHERVLHLGSLSLTPLEWKYYEGRDFCFVHCCMSSA